MEITEKVAYLKGLAEGMKLDAETNEGKLLIKIIDVLEDIALELEDITLEIDELADDTEELSDGLDVVSDDLEDLEDAVYGEYDDEDEDEDEDEFASDEEEDCYATTCPNCEETVYFDEEILSEGSVECPNCGEKLEFDLGSLEEDDASEE